MKLKQQQSMLNHHLTHSNNSKSNPQAAFVKGWRDYAASRRADRIKWALKRWMVSPLYSTQRLFLRMAGEVREESEKNHTFLAICSIKSQLYKLPPNMPLKDVYDLIEW